MDESKKKILLAVVAVAALGAAGYTMFGGGSADNTQTQGPAKKVERVKRDRHVPEKKTADRKRRRTAEPVERTVNRVDRTATERRPTGSKARRGGGRKLDKKKKLVPAS